MTAEEIRNAVIARRTQAGLKLVITKDGHTQTLYPKDAASLARWTAGYQRQGYTICTPAPVQ